MEPSELEEFCISFCNSLCIYVDLFYIEKETRLEILILNHHQKIKDDEAIVLKFNDV